MPRKRWDKHAIKAEVHRRGETLKSLSLKAGLSAPACATTLWGRPWPRAEQALADCLGVPVEHLFPERYRGTASRGKSSGRRGARKGQKIRTRTDRRNAA